MLSGLRLQVQSILYAMPANRKPALRRSDAEEALLATDLPTIAEEDVVQSFYERMICEGWTVAMRNGWLILDRPVPKPETRVPAILTGECGCCISLLLRHPGTAPAETLIREAVKAADAGRGSFERFCTRLHADLAVRLRKHEDLPGMLLSYLCQAYSTLR